MAASMKCQACPQRRARDCAAGTHRLPGAARWRAPPDQEGKKRWHQLRRGLVRARIDVNQLSSVISAVKSERGIGRGNASMDLIKWISATAPEIFLLLAVAIGTV